MSHLHAVERLLADYAAATAGALAALEDADDARLDAALDARDALAARLSSPLAATRGAVPGDPGWTAVVQRASEVRAAHAELERRLTERRDRLRQALDRFGGVATAAAYGSLAAPSARVLEIVR